MTRLLTFFDFPAEEVRVRDRVEIFRQVGVDDVGIAPAHQPVRFLDGIDRATTRSIAIGAVLEVRLEDRLQHDLGGGLNYPVPDRRHTPSELHSSPIDLGDRRRSPIPFIPYVGERLRF
jgi:hypothetical protein